MELRVASCGDAAGSRGTTRATRIDRPCADVSSCPAINTSAAVASASNASPAAISATRRRRTTGRSGRLEPSAPRRVAASRPRPAGSSAARVLADHLERQLAELGARLQPEVLVELPPQPFVLRECLRVTARAVEREHQLAAKALSELVRRHQLFELADDLAMATERERRFDPLLLRLHASLVESRDLRLRERVVREVGQRGAAPQREGLVSRLCGRVRVAGGQRLAGAVQQAAEPHRVDPAGLDPQHVAATARLSGPSGVQARRPGR